MSTPQRSIDTECITCNSGSCNSYHYSPELYNYASLYEFIAFTISFNKSDNKLTVHLNAWLSFRFGLHSEWQVNEI